MAEVASETGVAQKAIRSMIKECRLEIAPSSNVFMRCEICGTTIRFGRFCTKCETAHHREKEDEHDRFQYGKAYRRGWRKAFQERRLEEAGSNKVRQAAG